MKANKQFKRVLAGLACAGALALSANAQAANFDAGIISGDPLNPTVFNSPTMGSGGFLDTIYFDLGTNTIFNMTSTANNILFLAAAIFSNLPDVEVVDASPTHVSVFLPDLGNPATAFDHDNNAATDPLTIFRDYHLHPSGGVLTGSGSYQLTMWGSTAPVPLPAAAWLFGSGVIGLIGFARRKMNAKV